MESLDVPQHADASNNILIIDDSNEICSLLVTGIIGGCAESGRTCRVVQSSSVGLIEMIPLNFAANVFDDKIVNLYTASSPRNALPVLTLPTLGRLTIVCDIMMPNDTEVGLLGLLQEVCRLRLPVNLVFASSEGQNRRYVEELLNNRRAFFLEKGTSHWNKLPYALVENSDLFHYHIITPQDYQGKPIPRVVMPSPELIAATLAAVGGAASETPLGQAATPAENEAEDARQLKSSTGLLKLLTFWKGK